MKRLPRLRPDRQRRRERARAAGYRTPPEGIARYDGQLLAENDADGGPPGSLTPEARQQLDGALAEGIFRHSASRAVDDGQSVLDDIADVPERDFQAAPRHAVTAPLQGPRPQAAHGQPDPGAQPAPSFSPRRPRPTAETAAIPLPVAGRPYYSSDPLHPAAPVLHAVRPVIGDSLPALPAEPEPPAPPEPGSSPVLYAGPGWAGQLMNMRVADGEWDDVQAIAEHGLGRNAADEAAGYRHSRATIGGGMLQRCAVLGRPDLADLLLRHVHELNLAARAAAAAQAGAA